jgi:pilus assembly protein Flp/PilA
MFLISKGLEEVHMRIVRLLQQFHKEESGQGFIEYLLIAALLALAVIAGLSAAAGQINNAFNVLGSKLKGYVGT